MKKKNKSKEAKFFCESCGNEVPRNSRVCPSCGKFFASVRCPQCGRTGSNDDFKDGCPTCGYAVNPDGPGYTRSSYVYNNGTGNIKNSTKGKNNIAFSLFTNRNRESKAFVDSGLPAWVYLSTVMVLAVLMVCLYSCLK